MHEWAPGLAGNATYFDGEIPRGSTRRLPRFVDEYVMGQIEQPDNLARLPDLTTRTAIVILIETGLRSIDALRLRFDPVTVDTAGAPYLVYTNHKLAREAVIPISQRLLEQLRAQQAAVARRYASEQRHYLLPRLRATPDGILPYSCETLRGRLARWLAECEIRDASGRPVHVTPHQFRHTLATRLINNEVPLDTVQRLLDHNSPEMTARYAQIKDQTLRREWERYQQRINIRGEIVPLDPNGPLSDAAWAKENLARAKQTLPNGSCGLPLQQTCPHPNACLTCDHFLTTTEFLPAHRDQLTRTEQLIAEAVADGRQRLVEMNEPVRLNLVRIIAALKRSRIAMAAEPLAQAANARHRRAVEHAERALRDLDREGATISFQSVAQRAGVSRQWLYTQPALRAEIERLREHRPTRRDGVPARQRATEASLRQRLETLRAENQRLREKNAGLKTELAIAYGQQRCAERR